jgi:hypothetical protein
MLNRPDSSRSMPERSARGRFTANVIATHNSIQENIDSRSVS